MGLIKQINSYEKEIQEYWYEQNCFSKENLEYINKTVLKPFKMKEIPDGFGENSLIIEYKLNCYKIEIDKEKMCLVLAKRNQAINPKGLEHYHRVKNAGENGCFFGCDCFFDLINWIFKKD